MTTSIPDALTDHLTQIAAAIRRGAEYVTMSARPGCPPATPDPELRAAMRCVEGDGCRLCSNHPWAQAPSDPLREPPREPGRGKEHRV